MAERVRRAATNILEVQSTRSAACVHELGSDIDDGISKIVVQEFAPISSSSLALQQVLVDVKACAVNYPDLMQVFAEIHTSKII